MLLVILESARVSVSRYSFVAVTETQTRERFRSNSVERRVKAVQRLPRSQTTQKSPPPPANTGYFALLLLLLIVSWTLSQASFLLSSLLVF
jgi:hypothetical protein